MTQRVAGELWRSLGTSMMGRYGAYAAGLLSVMALARSFAPEHFGIVASVQVVFTFGMMLTESGLGPAIVNLERFDRRDRNGVYSVTLITGAVLGAGLLASGPALAAFYGEPGVMRVVPYLAASIVFAAASVVPLAHLQRDRRFLLMGAADATAELVATGAAIVALFSEVLEPVAALALRMSVRTLVRWLWVYAASSSTIFGRSTLGVNVQGVVPLLAFSTFQFGFNFVNFFSRNLDQVLVGRFLGASALGVYEKTYQLMRYPLMLLTFSLSPAIQPTLRGHAGDLDLVEALHRRLAMRLAMAGVMTAVVLYIAADLVIGILLGPGWDAVAPVLRVLALAIPVQVVSASSGGFFQALAKTRWLFASGLATALILTSAMFIGIAGGSLLHLAWAVTVAFHINFVLTYTILYRFGFRRSPRSFARLLLIPALLQSLLVTAAAAGWLRG